MTTRLELINNARRRIGATALTSESAKGGDRDVAIYDSVVADILGGYPWTFSTPTRQLQRLTVTPLLEYRYLYALPVDMDGSPREVWSDARADTPLTDYRLTVEDIDTQKRRCLATDAEAVWMTYTASIAPDFWPGNIREIVTRALMAEFALTIREDAPMRQRLREEVFGSAAQGGDGGLVGAARSFDASARASQVLARGISPLIAVRR